MPVAVDDAARRRQRRSFWPARISAPDTPAESLRIERVIALARMFLITITFVGIVLNPIDPPSYAPVAYLLLHLLVSST